MQVTTIDNSTGNAEYDRVLAVVKANDTEAGASMHDDFGHLGRECERRHIVFD